MGSILSLYKRRRTGAYARFPGGQAWCRKHRFNLIRAAILASSVALMLPGAWGHSVTVVEFAQLPAGLAAWQSHSLGIYRVCGPVSKLLYALPAHLMGIRVDYPAPIDDDVNSRQEWEVGRLFQMQNVKRYHDIYRWSRLLPMLLTVLGGCLVCDWSTRLFGTSPGIVSLCTWCWLPPILAHGSLVTSDMTSAVALLLAARCFWAYLLRPGLATTAMAGATLGLAPATKFTLLVLYPCWILLLIARAFELQGTERGESRAQRASPLAIVASAFSILIISLIVLDALYLFKDVGCRLEDLLPAQSSLAQDIHRLKLCQMSAWITRIPLPVPLEFLRGLDSQLAETENVQSAYLLGWTRPGGWWYWYMVASLIKIPLPVVALLGLALVQKSVSRRGRDATFWASLCLLAPAAQAFVLISATTGTGKSAAFRYLVPSLALLCVWIGRSCGEQPRIRKRIVVLLLGWVLSNAVTAAPDHLGWQNEAGTVWRRATGRPALIGDSLDWGQDLARLASWISCHSNEGSTIVCVYGLGQGEPYGMVFPNALAASAPRDHVAFLAVSEEKLFGDEAGNHCISIGGCRSFLEPMLRRKLFRYQPSFRVGRAIAVFRLRVVNPAAIHRGVHGVVCSQVCEGLPPNLLGRIGHFCVEGRYFQPRMRSR